MNLPLWEIRAQKAVPNRVKIEITHWEKLLDSDWLRDCEFIALAIVPPSTRGFSPVISIFS